MEQKNNHCQQNMTLATELEKLRYIKKKYEFMREVLVKREEKEWANVLVMNFNMMIYIIQFYDPCHSIPFVLRAKESFLGLEMQTDETHELISIFDNIYALLNLPMLW